MDSDLAIQSDVPTSPDMGSGLNLERQQEQHSESPQVIPFRLRSDLVVAEQPLRGGRVIAIKDPVSLAYYHFREREWFLLCQLNRAVTFAELQCLHSRKYPGVSLVASEMKVLVARAVQDGLLLPTDSLGMGRSVSMRHARNSSMRKWMGLFQILAIRFKGFDPELFLEWTAAAGRILFSSLMLLLVLVATSVSLIVCVGHWETIVAKLPDITRFLSGENLIYLLIALAFVKIFHELGHAMACKRFGGECHEMGFMLLAFMPCLYCNVSDTWMSPGRWQRIAVSIAGIYVELILANLALLFWYFSYPGIFQSVCLNVVLVCSLNTLFLNGNPLLRYDGYYVLSDLISVPNLAQQSRFAFWYPVQCWLTNSRFLFRKWRWRLALFALASMLYRCFIIFSILWMVHIVTKQWQIEIVGQLVTLIVVVGLLLPLCFRAYGYLRLQFAGRTLGQHDKVRWARLLVLFIFMGAALYLVWQIPVPHRVSANLEVELENAHYVFVPIAGRVESAIESGSIVQADDVLAHLSNTRLEFRKQKLKHQIESDSVQLDQLQNRLNTEQEVAYRIPVLEAKIAAAKLQLASVQSELDQLVIKSTVPGMVFSRQHKVSKNTDDRFLSKWSGDPLSKENRGAWLERGEWLCLVGDPNQIRLLMLIDQSEIEFVKPGDQVRVRMDHLPNEIFDGQVVSISREDIERVQPTAQSPESSNNMLVQGETMYRVIVRCSFDSAMPMQGSTGVGKVVASDRTLGQFVTRWLRQTIRFEY